MGLFVTPHLPSDRLQNALSAYAKEVDEGEVLALYDATLTGTGRDGAVFTAERLVFQNLGLQAAQTVRYSDLVEVSAKSRWFGLGGKKVELMVNRGRATFDVTIDFSGAPEAAAYVADFLDAALLHDIDFSSEGPAEQTDVEAVRRALDRLRDQQKLSAADYERLMDVLESTST